MVPYFNPPTSSHEDNLKSSNVAARKRYLKSSTTIQNRMKSQGSDHYLFSIPSRLTVRASLLTGLLLLSGGTMTVGAWAKNDNPTVIAQVPLSANLIYVNPTTGSDSANAGLSPDTPYRTITYALQQAQSGTVVQLAPGSYTLQTGEVFPLVVKQGVTLRGDEGTKGQTIGIIGGGIYLSPTLAQQNVTVLAQNNTEISGVGITNPNTRGTGLWVESTSPTIRNNTFSNSKREGVFISGTGNPRIEENIFVNNAGNGVSVAKTSRGEIHKNVFENTGIGIVVTETASPLITENRIVQNRDGIVTSQSSTPVLRKNVIEGNRENGVVAITNAQPDLGTPESPGENRIRNNGRFDVYNATRGNTLLAVGNDIDQKRISGRVNFVATTIPGGKFQDVQGHWAQAYIENLAAKDIIAGFSDGNFRPDDRVTRAQFAAIITKAFSPSAERTAINFGDVNSNYWAYQAIQTATRSTFLSGYPGGLFKPEQRIPRVQVLVALASGLKVRSDDSNVLSVYSDATQIPDYARTAIAGATLKQLVVNYPTANQLAPNREATRAEVAAFVYQALVNAGRAQAIPSPYVVQTP